jgi:hypothetical protein
MPAVDETTLLGLTTMLVANTGRYDLVGTQASGGDLVPNFAVDAGAYGYINKAVRWLERNTRHTRKARKVVIEMDAGDAQVTVPGVASVVSARIVSQPCAMEQADESWLRAEYSIGDLPSLASAETPVYWARAVKEVEDTDEVLWILPPPSADTSVEVIGFFYSAPLATGNTSNWWTVNWSEAVLYVAMQLVNDMDLNPFTNNTLRRLIEDIQRSVLTDDIMEEVAFYGDTMAG